MLDEAARNQLRDDGFYIVHNALTTEELTRARNALDHAASVKAAGGRSHDGRLDPNDANIRIYNLPAVDPVFIELLQRNDALDAARAVLGENILISNFSANIALPGSGSMRLHSDQALVVPPPWPHAWAANVIWCLDDVNEANGATRYLPGSHHFQSLEEVPHGAMDRTIAFSAPAGSFIVMEGRLWHTSGRNITANEQRRMLFAYYAADFIRPQMNWAVALPPQLQDSMDDVTRGLFGLGIMGNTRIGAKLTTLT